ncbi:MAG: hypothetical protein KDB94_02865, partial [Acidobacteria bacterium]|nr:hypothetical protein [Acidobacteriota bacterium]
EACNGLDDDCDGRVDEDFPDLGLACDNGEAGSCFDTGVRVCATNGTGTVCDAPPGVAGVETCNGLDDDCDGLTDEDQGPSCTCNPVPEICNGADDDGDGEVDEGVRLTVWADRDHDLFGDPGSRREICPHELGPGWVVNDYDCDDADARRSPARDNCPAR